MLHTLRMRREKKKHILLLVETSRIYGRRIIEGISRFAIECPDWILFCEDRGLLDKEPFWLETVKCDGIITRTSNMKVAKILRRLKIPIVELHGDGVTAKVEVVCDAQALGKLAAEHFLERGVRHFGFFAIGKAWWSDEFGQFFKKFLSDHGWGACAISPFCRRKSELSLPMIFDANIVSSVVKWLRSLPKPIGMLCPSDSQAVFLANVCHLAELGVPHEIAILGVEDNAILCKTTSPPISSIYVDGRMTGYEAAKLLKLKMEGRALPPRPILIPPSFVVTRQSTDFIAVDDPDIAKAAQFIRDHEAIRIQVDDVAESVSLSRRTLNRKFQEFLCRTPEHEILRVRMEHAKKLLRETDLPVAVISENIGYPSVEYFIKAFRRNSGMSPKQYRLTLLSGE